MEGGKNGLLGCELWGMAPYSYEVTPVLDVAKNGKRNNLWW